MSTELQEKNETKRKLVPKYKVFLHNDDVNSCDYVVESLVKIINTLNVQEATKIMWEAHNTGVSLIVTVPLEIAEFYKECLDSYGLTSTIEPE